MKLNAIMLCGLARIFIFFRELTLKLVIYDLVSLSWSGKHLVISHDTNVSIFQANRRKNIFISLKFNVVFKEAYCSRTLTCVDTYFGLIFRSIRKLIFVNNAHFFTWETYLQETASESLKFKRLSTNMAVLTFASW